MPSPLDTHPTRCGKQLVSGSVWLPTFRSVHLILFSSTTHGQSESDEGKPKSSESNTFNEEKGGDSAGRIYFTNLKEALGSVTILPDPIRGYDWKAVIRREGRDGIVEETFVKKTDGDGNEILDDEEEKAYANNEIGEESVAIGDVETKKIARNESAEMGVGDGNINDSSRDTPAPLNTHDDVSVMTTASRSIACQTDFGLDVGTQMEFDEVGNIVLDENLKTIKVRVPGLQPKKDEDDAAKKEATAKEEVKQEDAGEKVKVAGASAGIDASERRRRERAMQKEASYAAAVTVLMTSPRRAPVNDVPRRLFLDGRGGMHSGASSVGGRSRSSLKVSVDEKYQGRARGRRGTSVGSLRSPSVGSLRSPSVGSRRGTSVGSQRSSPVGPTGRGTWVGSRRSSSVGPTGRGTWVASPRGASVSSRRSRHSLESTESPRGNAFDPSTPSRWAETASLGGTLGSPAPAATAAAAASTTAATTGAEDESIVSGIARMFSSMTSDLADLITPMGMVVGGDPLSSSAPPGAASGWGPSPNAAPGWGPKREPEGPPPGSLTLPSESSSDGESSMDSKVSSADGQLSKGEVGAEGGESNGPSGRDLIGLNDEPSSPVKTVGRNGRFVIGLDNEEISFSTRSSAIETPSDIDDLSLGSFTDDSAPDVDETREDDDPRRKEEEKPPRSASTATAQENTDSKPRKAVKLEAAKREAVKGAEDAMLPLGNQDRIKAPKQSIEITPRGGSSPSVFSAISDSDEDSSSSEGSSSEGSSSDGSTTSSSTSSTDSSSSSSEGEDDSSEDSTPSSSEEDGANDAAAASRAEPVEGDVQVGEEVEGRGGFPNASRRRPEWITRKETRLGHPPPSTLIFHLKRFEYSMRSGRTEKLPGRVDAPEVLEADAFCADLPEGEGCRYRLVGAVVHVDPSPDGKGEAGGMTEGHYITLVRLSAPTEGAGNTEEGRGDGGRGGGGVWTEIDDDAVRSLDPDGDGGVVADCLHPALRAIGGCDAPNKGGGKSVGTERRYATLVVYSRER